MNHEYSKPLHIESIWLIIIPTDSVFMYVGQWSDIVSIKIENKK